MTLSEMIAKAIEAKPGNKEFILLFDGYDWTAEIGNPHTAVRLGETEGEVSGGMFSTPELAVLDLLEKLGAGE